MWMSRNLSLFFSLASGKGRTASDDVAPKRIPNQRPVCVGALLTYYIYKNYCGYTGYGHGQSQELTQHTVVKRQRLLADVSAAMVGYAVSTFVLRQRWRCILLVFAFTVAKVRKVLLIMRCY